MHSLLVRISVLAVCCHHVDSRVEIHRIGAVTAVDSVSARVVVSLDYVIAAAGANIVDPSVVSAHEVRAAPTEHIVVASAAPNLVGAPISRGHIVAAVALYSLATVEGPPWAARERIVARVTAHAVCATCAREVVVACEASYVVRTVG